MNKDALPVQDRDKTKTQLVEELARVRQQLADLGKAAEESMRGAVLLFQATPLAIHGCDAEGRITFVNAAQESITGYSADELLGTFIWDRIVPGPDKEMLPAYLKRLVVEQPSPTPFVSKNVRKNGELFDVRIDWNYHRNPDGQVIGFVTIVTDITEDRKAHAKLAEKVEERTCELRKSNEELAVFRRFAESSRQSFGMADMDDVITYVNPALCRLIGATKPEEVIGKHLTTCYPEGYARRRETEITPTILRDGHWEGEIVAEIGGKKVTVLQHCFLIRGEDGVPCRLATVITDITRRKEAEEALRRSEERFALVVHGAGVGIFDWDICRGKVYYSPRWKTLFGYDEDEIGDSPEEWARSLHPEEREWVLEAQEEFFRSNRAMFTIEYRFRHKNGSYRWITAHGTVVRNEEGQPCRLVGSHADITDRKIAEEALEQGHRTLKHLLQSSDHERQLIAYEIHDELAQQLAGAIMQFDTYAYQKDLQPELAAKAFDGGMAMLRQGHGEARRLINNVRPPVLDESGAVAAIAHLADEARRAAATEIEYASDVEFDRLTPILENAIYRICQEALNNACRHGKSKKVSIALTQHGDVVDIDIRDDGIGFCPDNIPESQFGITGMRERARLLGGTCSVESGQGKGTRIRARLPVVLPDEPAPGRPKSHFP